ncbi:MAG: glycosyltransferase [Planctomycetes bacterium]|nr:glycosyltransferase [Planctomycetota bacterium]
MHPGVKVLHVYSGNLYGGLEGMLATIARSSDVVPGFQSHFSLCYEGQLAEEIRTAGATVYLLRQVRMSRPWTVLLARRGLRRVVREIDPDAIICHSPWPLAVFGSVARTTGKPLVFWTHQYLTGQSLDQMWAKRCRPDLVVCNSRYTSESVATLFPNTPVEVVYCPYHFERVEPTDELRRTVRAELDTPIDAQVVVQASRLEWWKGQRLHLTALGRLRHLTGWVCWIVGGVQRPEEIKYLAELKTLTAQLGIADRVRFVGYRRDMPRILASADIVCHPNESPEHFGIAFVEGLAAGRPVIATRMGGALEIIDADCGILTKPTPEAVADAIEGLLADPVRRQTLGTAGLRRMTDLCDPRRNLTQLHQTLRVHFGTPVCGAT